MTIFICNTKKYLENYDIQPYITYLFLESDTRQIKIYCDRYHNTHNYIELPYITNQKLIDLVTSLQVAGLHSNTMCDTPDQLIYDILLQKDMSSLDQLAQLARATRNTIKNTISVSPEEWKKCAESKHIELIDMEKSKFVVKLQMEQKDIQDIDPSKYVGAYIVLHVTDIDLIQLIYSTRCNLYARPGHTEIQIITDDKLKNEIKDNLNSKITVDQFKSYWNRNSKKPESVDSINQATTPTDFSAGVKYDAGKLRFDLIPPEILDALAYIFTFGAKKYKERNCELGMDWGRVYSAAHRHLNSWWSGDVLDEETNKSHLWHALWNIAILTTYEQRNIGNDNRSEYAKNKIKEHMNKE